MAKDKIAMIYKGSGFFVSVPARDLTETEVNKHGRDFLLSLGLYEEAEQPKPKTSYKSKEIEDDPLDEESED